MRRRTGVVLAIAGLLVLLVGASTVTVLTGQWDEDPCGAVRSGSGGDPVPWSGVAGLAVGFGYDSVAEQAGQLDRTLDQIDDLDPDAVSVSAGRVDWTTFPWAEHEEDWSEPVSRLGCDLLGRALDALGTRPDGSRRARIIVVDTFVGGWIAADPTIAGVAADGSRSPVQASVAQLESGAVGDRIVELVGEVARRYRPEAISLTELFTVRYTFGDDDLASYQAFSGASDWPRDASGEIDEASGQIAAWRSSVVAGLVARARDAAHRSGVPLLMEVRVNWSDPTAGRPESGQDYELLVAAADQLVSWDYFALAGRSPLDVQPAVSAREQRWPGRWVSSVGLWARSGATAAPADVATATAGAFAGGSQLVWVTPESLFSPEHWAALAGVSRTSGG